MGTRQIILLGALSIIPYKMDNTRSKREYKLSISIGTAYFDPLSPCTIDELLSQADRLMYEQKRTKKGLVDQP